MGHARADVLAFSTLCELAASFTTNALQKDAGLFNAQRERQTATSCGRISERVDPQVDAADDAGAAR